MKNQSHDTVQGAAHAEREPSDSHRHSGASPKQYLPNVVEAKKLNVKSSRGAMVAAKRAILVVPLRNNGRVTGPPKKFTTSIPTGKVFQPALQCAKSAKDAQLRAVRYSALSADRVKQKWSSDRLRGDVEKLGAPLCPAWLRNQRVSTASARVHPVEIRKPRNLQRARKFDLFKAPSVLDDPVQASEGQLHAISPSRSV
ncbi:hypothetical protein HPB51_007495 [Rhipicephalus microplus]|uniref:Uncharacterized protein n=1 Tax=Rhipicephalus microplus TaxID=6941 RepID=A0A9J6DT48_RHIMP|nr:hypothetical protein HPB51_007495 [Rhipicephalus microplus]